MGRASAVALLLACACASPGRYVGQGKTQQEFYRDHSKCRATAGQATAGQQQDVVTAIYYRHVVQECMAGEGWRYVEGD